MLLLKYYFIEVLIICNKLLTVKTFSFILWGFTSGTVAKNLPASAGFDRGVRENFWSRKWQTTPVFLPGKFHGQRLMAYSPWDRKESDTTEHTLSGKNASHNRKNTATEVYFSALVVKICNYIGLFQIIGWVFLSFFLN